jgi:hypothetical protein
MKQMVFILALVGMILIPGISMAEHGVTSDVKDLDRAKILEIKHNLINRVEDLSLLRAELGTVYTSMTSSQGEERYLIMHSQRNIQDIEGVYKYAAHALGQLLLINQDKISYYHYLKEYGIDEMESLIDEYVKDIHEMHGEISNQVALHVIDQATENIHSSSELLDRAMGIIEEYSEQTGLHLRHH